uniref:Fanconi Anaemia group E protein C-terminal domain-containing protein n=1 Tax=Cuerna arida TaxID=1464854 RepID=A0A1B6G4X5_9HEMI
MDQILTEKDLINKGHCWGEWTFSISDDTINEKIASLPRMKKEGNCSTWSNLFSLVQTKSKVDDLNCSVVNNVPSTSSESHHTVEESKVPDTEAELGENIVTSSMEELSVSLVELCNQLGPKLRVGTAGVKDEMKILTTDLKKLRSESLTLLMENTWSQLHSDGCKLCFCIPFITSSDLCEILCQRILLPWMSESLPSRLEQLSEILSPEGEIVCVTLVAPLLRLEDSPLVHDLLNLEDFMSSMSRKHWTVLLREFLSGLGELHKWQVSALATIVQHAEPTCDILFILVQLMSATGSTFAQSREFGALIVAVANHLKADSGSLVSQLKLIANNYKGSLKFKALKVLADVS